MLNIIVRTIRHELVFRAPDPASSEVLAYTRADPSIDGPPPSRIDIDIKPLHGFLQFVLPSGFIVEGSASHLLSAVHGLHFTLSRNEFPGSPLIHGGTLTTEKGHVVFVGDKGAGKTTLLADLASEGWPVAGDEHIFVHGDMATPRPRSLRVRVGTLRYLSPAAAAIVRGSPSITDWEGAPLYAVEPSAFGKEWRIGPRPLRHLVILRANHGGRSRIRELDPDRALQLLLRNVMLPDTHRATALAWLRSSLLSASCWELWNGRLEDSREIVYQRLVN